MEALAGQHTKLRGQRASTECVSKGNDGVTGAALLRQVTDDGVAGEGLCAAIWVELENRVVGRDSEDGIAILRGNGLGVEAAGQERRQGCSGCAEEKVATVANVE